MAISQYGNEYYGLSGDVKPLGTPLNGRKFTEMDTSKEYRFDAENQQWLQQSGGGGGGGVRVINGVYSAEDYEISTTITAAEMLAAYLAGEVVIHWVESLAGPGGGTVDVDMYALLYSAESAGELGAMFHAIGRSDLRASLTPLTNTVTFITGS